MLRMRVQKPNKSGHDYECKPYYKIHYRNTSKNDDFVRVCSLRAAAEVCIAVFFTCTGFVSKVCEDKVATDTRLCRRFVQDLHLRLHLTYT